MTAISFCRSLLISPFVFGLLAVTGTSAIADEVLEGTQIKGNMLPAQLAQEQVDVDALVGNSLNQVTSVSQLSDVQPTDWAFQALQSLVERYGCIAGYPDGTYRGNRALTRYEFAAGVNACLDRVNELITAGTADLVGKEDLATLGRLQEEFSAELVTLRGRVDALEARTAEIEANQFSTTTKLEGEAVFAIAGIAAGDNALGEEVDRSVALGHRTRLNLETSFTGRDLLRTRLQAEGLEALSSTTLTPEGDLAFAGDSDNDVSLDALLYSFPLGENTEVVLAANSGAADDFASTVNFLDGDGATGALSAFGTRHPIYYLVEGAGLGIRHEFGNALELSLGYLASDAAEPSEKSGLFDGAYGALAQLLFKPSDRLNVGLTFVHAYKRETGTGSNLANPQAFISRLLEESSLGGNDNLEGLTTVIPIVSNSLGLELSWQLSNKLVLGGWAGYTFNRTLSSGGGLFERGDFETVNWAVTLGFPDLGKEGNLAGIIVGMEPKVVGADIRTTPAATALAASLPTGIIGSFGEDRDTSLHIEAFYQYQVNDNISITPGVIWLTAPDHNSANNDIVIGTIRTTFAF
ncbi:iron uptake porin [Trichocoleus sp. FACHB-591]|uniref:iron uptake porin n=1 Tax=Trichocoleus sp. FACHB-591 TaxID=2692872 RepID=UPI001684A649|nr:iron uptake porin [Trichocoleus sp. FACHB-591]MBD2094672.1 iron uptake porin [Trichocoleus sp. FACHB-591]